eukprot:246042_1
MYWFTRIFTICIVSVIGSNDFLNWIHPYQLEELETAYYNIFDHNNDGMININEIRLGILSQLQSNLPLTDTDAISFIPTKYSCNPSLDFVDFADCISIAARLLFKYNLDTTITTTQNENILFNDIFGKYIGECTDKSPFENKYCYDIVQASPDLCMTWSRTNQPFCQLSCLECDGYNIKQNIFSNKYEIRGLNGEYIYRPEKLNLYSIPQELKNINAAANCTAVAPTNHSGQILFVSDIHVEPWYDVDGTSEVSRFKGANVNNMWQCRDSKGNQVACTLEGHSDPPYPMFKSGIDFLKSHALPKNLSLDILIMPGDTQAHSYTSGVSSSETQTIPPLMNKVLNEMLTVFNYKNIFYAAGNNDGQHDIIFASGSNPAINYAWAKPFFDNKIVNNNLNRLYKYQSKTYDSIHLFNVTGYYIKKIPSVFNNSTHNQNFYAIILNTNLGSNNGLQNNIFNQDLEWIKNQTNGHLIVIGHHPNIVQSIIPSKYKDIVKGSFAGHVHFFQPTDNNGFHFAICPAIIQESAYAGVLTGDLNNNGNIVLTWNNFNQYLGQKNTLPQEDCWGYKGKP